MKGKLYVIFDKVAHETNPPMLFKNDGVALRVFQSMVQDNKVNPDDYDLYAIADYDTDNPPLSNFRKVEAVDVDAKQLEMEDLTDAKN
jgi:hypothetical protein